MSPEADKTTGTRSQGGEGSLPSPKAPTDRSDTARFREIIPGVGAVAAAVVVVLALYFAGLIPYGPHGGSSPASPQPMTSSSAGPIAQRMATSLGAGKLDGVLGISPTSSFAAKLSNLSSTCPLGGPDRSAPTIAGSTGNYSSGAAEAWVFVFFSVTNWTVSLIEVAGEQAHFLGSYSGEGCVGSFASLDPLPTTYGSSVEAAQTADREGPGVGSFVARHSAAAAEYVLMAENNSSTAPLWKVLYTTCPVGPTLSSGSGSFAVAFVDAGYVAAAPIWTGSFSSTPCGEGGDPIPGLGGIDVVSLAETRHGPDAPGYYATLMVTATPLVATNASGLMLVNATSAEPLPTTAVASGCSAGVEATTSTCPAPSSPGTWYAVLTNRTGTVVATYGGSPASWSYSAGVESVPLTAGDYVFIVSSDVLHDGYVFTPYGAAEGTGTPIVSGAIAL